MIPTDVDIQNLSTEYVTGSFKNEQSHIDWLNAEIAALKKELEQHTAEREKYGRELIRRNPVSRQTMVDRITEAEARAEEIRLAWQQAPWQTNWRELYLDAQEDVYQAEDDLKKWEQQKGEHLP